MSHNLGNLRSQLPCGWSLDKQHDDLLQDIHYLTAENKLSYQDFFKSK